MSEKPILFNAENIRAILKGTKTQTRRVIKSQPMTPDTHVVIERDKLAIYERASLRLGKADLFCHHFHPLRYGRPGDSLWVRESIRKRDIGYTNATHFGATYLADFTAVMGEGPHGGQYLGRAICDWKWKRDTLPSIHMPRWASRITLEITEIRVERVQELNREDYLAEGIPQFHRAKGVLSDNPPDPNWKFIELWNSINAKRGFAWEDNPWVWVISFEVEEPK